MYPSLRLCARSSRVRAKDTLGPRTNNAVFFFITVHSSLYSTFLTRSNELLACDVTEGFHTGIVEAGRCHILVSRILFYFLARCVQDAHVQEVVPLTV